MYVIVAGLGCVCVCVIRTYAREKLGVSFRLMIDSVRLRHVLPIVQRVFELWRPSTAIFCMMNDMVIW